MSSIRVACISSTVAADLRLRLSIAEVGAIVGAKMNRRIEESGKSGWQKARGAAETGSVVGESLT